MAELSDAVERRSACEIEKAAHTLLGALLVLGARRSAEGARRLEEAASEGQLEDVKTLHQSLEREIAVLIEFLAVQLEDRPGGDRT